MRSRGIDISAIALRSGSRRSSIVVSERPGSSGSLARLSEPRMRMFSGSPPWVLARKRSTLFCSTSLWESASAMLPM